MKGRLYNVQLILNVPVWATSDGKAAEIAGEEALYEETTQLAQGDTKLIIGSVEAVQEAAEAKRLGWGDEDMPWGRKDQKTIVQLLEEEANAKKRK